MSARSGMIMRSRSGSTTTVKGESVNSSAQSSARRWYTWSSAPTPQPGMSDMTNTAPSLSRRRRIWSMVLSI